MKVLFRFIGVCIIACSFIIGHAQAIRKDTSQLTVHLHMPRFLREGDRLELAATIRNSSGSEQTGQVQLQLFDAMSNTSVDGWFQNIFPVQYFTVAPGKAEVTLFPVEVPYLFKKAMRWRMTAQAETLLVSETALVPVLTNKTIITETATFPVEKGTRNYTFDKLLQADAAEHHSLSVELFENLIWHVVKALPYLASTNNFNAEQVWNSFYAYALAAQIITTTPDVNNTMEQWKKLNATDTFLQNTNALLTEEAPWMLNPTNEAAEKKKLALFFDSLQIRNGQQGSFQKLQELQNKNGSFSWFPGGPEDRFITQTIVTGIGHLKKLRALPKNSEEAISHILLPALSYLDKTFEKEYEALLKKKKLQQKQICPLQVHYLYLRSFFTDVKLPETIRPAYGFYLRQAQQSWKTETHYLQAMLALALQRSGNEKIPKIILQSIKDKWHSTSSDKNIRYNWWQNPDEENALLIEAISEINKETKTIEPFTTALLNSKAYDNWRTPKATAMAGYALLLKAAPLVNAKPIVRIRLGDSTLLNTNTNDTSGSGYFTKIISGTQLQPELGTIEISAPQPAPTHLPVFITWQHFQDAPAATFPNVHIRKQLFVQYAGTHEMVDENSSLHIGDTITVRLTITSKNNLEYIKITDAYAAASRPLNREAGFQSGGQFDYYQNSESARMNFYVPALPNGKSILEYKLLVTHAGIFSNGFASITSVYTPWFATHSEAIRIQVE